MKQFLWKHKICTPAVFFPPPSPPPSTFSDFSCRRLSTNEENSVVQAARQTPEASMLLNWWKSQKQEFHGGKTKLRIHWNWIGRVTCCASHADGTSWSDMWTFSWSDMCKSDDCRLSIEQIKNWKLKLKIETDQTSASPTTVASWSKSDC